MIENNSKLYNSEFYDNMYENNKKVAEAMLPPIINCLGVKSMVDVGCGQGIFTRVAKDLGVEVLGIDGDWVDQSKIYIEKDEFQNFNLENKIKVNKRYDLAISLEVAEHIDSEYAQGFVENLTELSDVVLFSAAIPGQGGTGHINEQWQSYWEHIFKMYNFQVITDIRNIFWNEKSISPVRRQNILLFVKKDKYNDIKNKLMISNNILDVVHPEVYQNKNNAYQTDKKKIEIPTLLKYIDYNKLASDFSKKSIGELIDNIELFERLMNYEDFKNNYKCIPIDNKNKGNYPIVIWGAGQDGKALIRILKMINYPISMWCDKNENKEKIDEIVTISVDEMIRDYTNELVIIATRKYKGNIITEIFENDKYNKIRNHLLDKGITEKLDCRNKAILDNPPEHVTIGITSACNNKCLFCSYHGEDSKDRSNVYEIPFCLSLDKFKKMVDMAYQGNVPKVHVCGTGEPFLNPNVIEMIDYVVWRYGSVSFQTNFFKQLFEKKHYLEEIVKRQNNIEYITVDICSGIEEQHEKIKNGSKFEDLVSALSYISKNSNIEIRAFLILTKSNYIKMENIIDTFLANGIKNFRLDVGNLFSYNFSEFTSNNNVYTSNDKEITKKLQELVAYGKERGIEVTIPQPADLCQKRCSVFWEKFQTWPVQGCDETKKDENMIPMACNAVVNGDLNSLGYLLDYENIMDAWNNPKLVSIRENLLNGKYPSEFCKDCCMYHLEDQYYKQVVRGKK